MSLMLIATGAWADATDGWSRLVEPSFRHYGQNEGLPNPIATRLAEDGEGYLWVGTEGGVARWDGYRFRGFKPGSNDPGTLPDGWVTALHTDTAGRLWVGMSAGGLARFDNDAGRFVIYGAGPTGLSSVHVSAIEDDGAGGLWVGTEKGLDHLDPKTGKITSLKHVDGDALGLPDDRILALLRDRNGLLWIGTRRGLVQRDPSDGGLHPVVLDARHSEPMAICSFFQDTSGTVWIGTVSNGAFWIKPGDATPREVVETGEAQSPLQHQWVATIASRGPDEIWLGTYGQGLVLVNTRTGQTHRVHHEPLLHQSLSEDTVWALHQDRAGALWTGTSQGVSRLTASFDNAVLTVTGKTGQHAGLTEDDVPALLPASDGTIWAGLQGKGIDIVDPRAGTVVNIAADATKPETSLPDTYVLALAEVNGATVYAGTNRGLYRIDRSTHAVARVAIKGRDPAARNSGLLVMGDRLWVAGTDDGAWSLPLDGNPASETEHLGGDRLTDARVNTFAGNDAGEVWIGTRNGLNRVGPGSTDIEKIFADPANPEGLAAGGITALAYDSTGRLWVGTFGGGIQVLVGRKGGRPVFSRITTAQGLPNENVDSMQVDSNGKMWVSTDDGIAVVDPSTFKVQKLQRADGVEISDYWTSSHALTQAGEVLFGGPGGFTVVRTERFKTWDYRPPVVATEFRLNGKIVLPEPAEGPHGQQKLVIKPEENSVSAEFAALDFSAPEHNRYAYRLEGFDSDWIETDANRRIASYTNLPPGNYTLHLRGSNRNGLWTEATLNLPIMVMPAWYQTYWFRGLAILAALASIYLLVQGRTQLLRRRQRELEREVAERTAALEASQKKLEQMAYQDALTGLANRRHFSAELSKLAAAARPQSQRIALLLVDLDHFKNANDTLGHDAGDALLVEVAKRLQASVRASDQIARLGGDEFAIILEDFSNQTISDDKAVELICTRILSRFSEPIEHLATRITIGASIGVAWFPDHGQNARDIYKAADLALYDAKRGGRATWRWYDPSSITAPCEQLTVTATSEA